MSLSAEPEQGCPHCGSIAGRSVAACPECDFPIEAFSFWESEPCDHAGDLERPPIEFQNAGAIVRVADPQCLVVGRSDDPLEGCQVHAVRHRGIRPRHLAMMRDESDRVWIRALDSTGEVFVNGWRVTTACLRDGDVLQIGPLAWRFNTGKGVLTPVAPIAGVDLDVDAEVPQRLTRTRLRIRRGEMTALVGPSGCGKSTLLETIRDGSGLVSDQDLSGNVFFVPQQDWVHHDLRLGEALEAIGQLYGREVLPFEIDAALDSVGLPPAFRVKFPSELSGGQLRRFRIAGALLSGAGVIILDEPDSGLDHQTADEIIALLRALAVSGATVVAVTHHRHVLESFDRVITMRSTSDGGAICESGESELPSRAEQPPQDDVSPESAAEESRESLSAARQIPILIRREIRKLVSPRLSRLRLGPIGVKRWVVGMLLVPILFALAVSLSVPTDPARDVDDGLYGEMSPIIRLGFLAVVSVIWMSASGSHLSITRDRELYEYERSYGLTWGRILTAKTVVLSIAGVLQTLVFAVLLYLVRERWLEHSFFVDERSTQLVGVVVCLCAVSVAASVLGLLVSAIAGKTPLVATAILPVLMMVQILFSAPFAVANPDGYEPLADYERLTIFAETDEADSDDDWDNWEDDAMGESNPLWATSAASYATLSRYGDLWLRSFAVTVDPPENGWRTRRGAAASLAGMTAFAFVASWLVLCVQTSRLGRRRVRSLSLLLVTMAVLSAGIARAAEPERGRSVTIRVPLVDGRYDENRLRVELGAAAEDSPRWRTFDNQDRIGLVALELVGKIRFELTADELTIELKEGPNWALVKQLAPPRLIGVDEISGQSDVIVFVHGLEGGASTFAKAADRLRDRSVASIRFDYPNDGPPEEIGRRLAEQLGEFASQHDAARIHIVAHSLGGLVATWAVAEDAFPAESVPNLFTLGTPFRGSALAVFHNELELFDVVYRLATGQRGALNTIQDGRGEAADALKPGSDFLAELHRRPRPRSVRFHLAAGTKSFLNDSRRDRLVAQLPGELARLAVSPDFARKLDRLLATDELRDGRGDGAVTVESALGLSNPATSTTFALSHTALVSSEEPLEWVLGVVGVADPAKPVAK